MTIINDIKNNPKLSKVFPAVIPMAPEGISLDLLPKVSIAGEVRNPEPPVMEPVWNASQEFKENMLDDIEMVLNMARRNDELTTREEIRLILNTYFGFMARVTV